METRRITQGGFSPIEVVAAISAIALVGSLTWVALSPKSVPDTLAIARRTPLPERIRATSSAQSTLPELNASPVVLSPIGSTVVRQLSDAYSTMVKNGSYTQESGAAAAQSIAEKVTPAIVFHTYVASDIPNDSDTSKTRVTTYRQALQVALAPLMKNQDFELEIFGRYTDTHDEKYLNDLRVVADNYRAAIANTSIIVVPADAIPSHVKILNAMAKFTSVLDGLIENAHDPFATAVVLKAFTVVEGDMVTSFNDIGAYAAHKLL